MNSPVVQAPAFAGPALAGLIAPDQLAAAAEAARDRRVPLARILHYEYGIPRHALLAALAEHYQCPAIEYDERLPIPPELLRNMPGPRMVAEGWFPVIKDVDGTVVVAAVDPADPGLTAAVTEVLGPGRYEFRVALPDDIGWFVQDFLHAPVGELIGTERTGLAYWRNIMAQWRTRMACYRTDLAKARTALAIGRAGLALTTICQDPGQRRVRVGPRPSPRRIGPRDVADYHRRPHLPAGPPIAPDPSPGPDPGGGHRRHPDVSGKLSFLGARRP